MARIETRDRLNEEGEMCCKEEAMLNVVIRTLDTKEFRLQVRRDMSVEELKKEVANATSIAVESQRLMSAGKEMADDGKLADFIHGKSVIHDSLLLYLVVRFPGASFALPSEEDSQSELPVTVGEESMMRSSRIVLRGTVTIPVPERDMQRVVHRILNRGSGSTTPSLEDLVSSMSYLPRYRRLEHDQEGTNRRVPAAGHRRRRRRRLARANGLAVDLRAHSVSHVAGNSLAARALRPDVDTSLHSWSHYLDLELQNADSMEDGAGLEELQPGSRRDMLLNDDSMFDQSLGLDLSHQSAATNGSLRRVITDLDDIDHVDVDNSNNNFDGGEAGGAALDWRDWTSADNSEGDSGSGYPPNYLRFGSYQLPDLEDEHDSSSAPECTRSSWRATRVSQGTTSRGECDGAGWYTQVLLPPGRMTGKRKHSEMCSQILMEHRLTTRCRNLSLDDTSAQGGIEEDERGQNLDAASRGVAATHEPSTHPFDALAALDRPTAALCEATVTGALGSTLQQLDVAAQHQGLDARTGGVLECDALGEEMSQRMTMSGQAAALASRVPSASSDNCNVVADSAFRHGTGGVEDEQEDELALREERDDGRRVPATGRADSAAAEQAEASNQVCLVQCSAAPAGKSCSSSSSSSHQVTTGHEDAARDKEWERRMLQDKEGGIHVSCDPLASLPLEELAQSAASAVPLPSALLSSLARNASGNDIDNKAKACQPLVPDTQLLPVSPPSAPLDRFLLDASPAGAAGSVSRSASSGPSSAGATALEAVYKTQVEKLDSGNSCKARGHGVQVAEGGAAQARNLQSAKPPHNKCCVVM